MAVTDLDLHTHGDGEFGNADPVDAVGAQSRGGEFGVGADGDAVARGVDLENVERIGRGYLETLALPDSEVGDAFVATDHFAAGGDEFAGRVGHFPALLFEVGGEELLVIAAGDEADFLRVGLLGERQAVLPRNFADLGLVHAAQRKECVRELLLGEAEEEVGLILAEVSGTLENPTLRGQGRTR